MRVLALDHIQLAMPAGEEARARAFYEGILCIPEVAKPPELAKRGGAWFECCALKIHLGVDPHFVAARKAHPAFLVEGLPQLVKRLEAAGHKVTAETGALPARAYVDDPFGNRLELIAADTSASKS